MVVCAFACLVVALQQTLVVPAVPQFPHLLGTSAGAVSWLVTATLLTGAIATPVLGRLSDMVGRRRMMVIAMACVLVGSLLAPVHGIATVIAGRALQGMGTALVPVAMAQMRDLLPGHRVGGALAILSATLGVGGGIGVPLGGVLLAAFGWQSMFWSSAALAALAIGALVLIIPADAPRSKGGFDIVGAVLLAIGLALGLLALSQGEAWGWASPAILGAALLGISVLLGWGKYELRHHDPLVDLRSCASRPILFTNIASVLLGVLMFTNLLLTTVKLQNPVGHAGFDWSADAAGLAMLPNAAAMFAVAPFSARVAGRFGPRVVLMIGAGVTAAGYLLTLTASISAAWVIAWTTLIGIGVGIGYAALPMLISRYSPAHMMGAAQGVNALMRAIGTAISSALVAAISLVFAATGAGPGVPSAQGLWTIAGVGVILAGGTFVLARQARANQRRPKEQAA